MIDRTRLAVLFGLLGLACGLQCPKQKISPGREVVCYTSISDAEQLTEAVCKCTTLVHKGHDVRNVSISGFEGFQKSLKGIIPTLQFVISVDDPGKTLRTSGTARQEITARLIGVLKEVDGVELNMTAGSRERLQHFVKGLKDELVRKSYEKRIFLVLPTKSEDLAKQFDLKELTKYVDLFTIPTHYLVEDDEAYRAFHPSRLMGLFDMFNADSLIDLISGLGAPKRKILMSVPASAYRFTLKDQDDNAPRAPTEEIQPAIIDQKQLCEFMNRGEWTVERDEDLTAPYAFKDNMWIAFEDKISLSIKGKYVLLRDLPGMAIHDIENDFKTKCGKPLTHEIHHSFSDFKRKSRAAVLNALEDDLHQTELEYPTKVKSSDFRVVRVVDTEGHIRAVRENTQTEFTCSRQGYFVHPKSCNRFYRCVKFNQEVEDYSVFEFDCPAGLSFDERTEVCVWPGSMPEGSPCPGSSEIAPVTRIRFECPSKSGYYADPQNPRWFFACIDLGGPDAMAYEFRCPFGLIFDEQKLICEWPWLVAGYSGSGYTRPEYNGYGTGSTPGTGGYYTGGLPHGYTGTESGGVGYSGAGFSGPAGVGYSGHSTPFGHGTTGPPGVTSGGHGISYGGQGTGGYSGTTGSGYSGSAGAGGHGTSYGGQGTGGYSGTTGSGYSGSGGAGGHGTGGYSGSGGAGGYGTSYGGQGTGGYSGAGGAGGHGTSYGGQGTGGYSGTTGSGYSGSGGTDGHGTGGYSGSGGAGGHGTGGYSGSGGSGGHGTSYGGQGTGGYSGTTGSGYSGSGGDSGHGIGGYSGSGGARGHGTGGYSGSGGAGGHGTSYGGQVTGGYTGTTGSGYSGSGGADGHGTGGYSGSGGAGGHGTSYGGQGTGGYSGTTGSGYSGSGGDSGHGIGGYSGSGGARGHGTGGYSGSGGAGGHGTSYGGQVTGGYTGTTGSGYSGSGGADGHGTGGYSGSGGAGGHGTGGYSGSGGAGGHGTSYGGQGTGGYTGTTGSGYSGSGGADGHGTGGYSGSGGAGGHGTGGYSGSGGAGGHGTSYGGQGTGGYTGTTGSGYSGSTGAGHGGSTGYSGATGSGAAGHGTYDHGTGYTQTTGSGYSGSGGSQTGHGYSGTGAGGYDGSQVTKYSGTTGTGQVSETGYTGAGGIGHSGTGGIYSGTGGTGYTGSGSTVAPGHGYSGFPGSTGGSQGGYSGAGGIHGGSTGGGYSGTTGSGQSTGGYSGTGGIHGGSTGGGYSGTTGSGQSTGGYSGTGGIHGGSGGTGGIHGGSTGGYSGPGGIHEGSTAGGYAGTPGTGQGGATGGYSGAGGIHGGSAGGYSGPGGIHGGSAGGYSGPGGIHGGSTGGYSGPGGIHGGSTGGGYSGTTGSGHGGATGGYSGTGGIHGGITGTGGIHGGSTGTSYAGSTAGVYTGAAGGHAGTSGTSFSSAGVYTGGVAGETQIIVTEDYGGVKGSGSPGTQYVGPSYGTKIPGSSGGVDYSGTGSTQGHGYSGQPGTSYGIHDGSSGPGQTIAFGTHPSQTPIYVNAGSTGIESTGVTSLHSTPGPVLIDKPNKPTCITTCIGSSLSPGVQAHIPGGVTSGTNVYQGTSVYVGGLNGTYGSHVPSFGSTTFGAVTPSSVYGVTSGPGAVVTGHNIPGSIVTGDSTTGTVITYGDTSGAVLTGGSDQGSVVTGDSHPGYTKTAPGTPGYVISGGVKTVYPGSGSPGSVVYGTSSSGVVVTGSPDVGTVVKGHSSPGIILTGQTAPGVSIHGAIDQGTVIESTDHHIITDSGYSPGITPGYGTKIGTVTSTYDTSYKTNEYHDNGGRGTIRFNNGDVTTKYTENDIPDYRPAGGTIPSNTFLTGSKGVPTASTPRGFIKTGPALSPGGSYVISTGTPRPAQHPENIGPNAFRGSVAGYTKSSTESSVYIGRTSSYDQGVHVDTSKVTVGPSKEGYSYPTPNIPFETGVTKNLPISATDESVIGPTTPTPFLNVEVYNTPKISSPGGVGSYQRPSGFTKTRISGTPVGYTTGPLENYRTTVFEAAKIPVTISSVHPVIDTGYQTVISSTPVPVTIGPLKYGEIQTGSQFDFGTKQQGGYISSTTPSSIFGSTPKSVFDQNVTPSGVPGSFKPQTQYQPITISPAVGVTYRKPFPLPDVTYQSTPKSYTVPPSGYSLESTTISGGSPTNVAIPRDQVDKLVTNYNRGTTKYVPSQYDVYNSGSISGADYSRTQTSGVSTHRQSYGSTTPSSIGRTQLSSTVTSYGGGYSKPSQIITYQTTAKSTAVSKGKVIVKWSDLHPLLLGKLGAECTCRGDPFANLRGPGSKLINSSKGKVDLANYDESDIYVDLEKEGSYEDHDYASNHESSSAKPVKISNNQIPQLFSSSSQIQERPSSAYLPSVTPSVNLGVSAVGFSNRGFTANHRSAKSLHFDSSTQGSVITAANVDSPLDGSDEVGETEETFEGEGTTCARPGLFRHPNFCNKFYACHWDEWKKKFTLHVFNCPVHLTFDNGAAACNWPSMGPACQDNNLLV